MVRLSEIFQESRVVDNKNENDTLRLWEGYREQASLWRSIAVFQFLTTPLLLVLILYVYATRSTVLHVPPKPLPGHYATSELPEALFLSQATEFINLVATYQPKIARSQFTAALNFLLEPALSSFSEEMMGVELRAIESTQRTQLFFVDPSKTQVRYAPREVIVTLEGERVKLIAGRKIPSNFTRYAITMRTVPRNNLNPYGLMITNVQATELGTAEE